MNLHISNNGTESILLSGKLPYEYEDNPNIFCTNPNTSFLSPLSSLAPIPFVNVNNLTVWPSSTSLAIVAPQPNVSSSGWAANTNIFFINYPLLYLKSYHYLH